ncbi:hypothetical protein BGZ96_011276 [Linnemannia gamsii]|uniref:Uncharacterized protein n=1 Tax=Linnemannia gamsii TaxID=64522 RepID=A0ABQ7JTK0_9FUNG|nr:hypothetical protein BGZ96_011276 [Linnemannia gamsii]
MEATPLSPESIAGTPIPTASTINAATSKTPGTTISITPGSSSAVTDGSQAPAPKIEKKRGLLTGEGLDELGDILNGPGMTTSASPSKSLQFLPSKTRINAAELHSWVATSHLFRRRHSMQSRWPLTFPRPASSLPQENPDNISDL